MKCLNSAASRLIGRLARAACACLALAAAVSGADGPPRGYSIPTIDLAAETHRQVVVDREAGQYLGHPSTLLLPDNKTILIAYPKGHGKGAIVYKKSFDGGLTWTDRLETPENWATSMEVPTLFRLIDPQGVPRILMFSGKAGGIRVAYSLDEGETWSPLQPIRTPGPSYGGIVAMSSMVELKDGSYMALFHDDGRWLRNPPENPDDRRFEVYKVVSTDGGLTWSQPEIIAKHPVAHLCEPGALRSPDGKQIAVLLRENSRKLNSFVIFSDDEGETWSEPRELPGALTGDRHTAKYAPDGRLFISFRDRTHVSPTSGDWVGWVGTYEDIVEGREGQYRVRLMDNHRRSDTAYPGVELLPDGTIVTTTYGHWTPGEEPYVVSVRFKMEELDARARSASNEPTSSVRVAARPAESVPDTTGKPNVLFIAVDDLNDWVLERDSPIKMPNFRRLARRGALFRRAYTASPACNPSRVALLTGLSPATTGVYGNRSDWRKALPNAVTLPRYFMDHGYRVEGAGKIFHHHDNSAYHDDESFHRFQKMQLDPMPTRKFNGIGAVRSANFDWGQWPFDESATPDVRSVDFGIEFLSRPPEQPFFLAIGLFRPHMPFHVPPKYFAEYPAGNVAMPRTLADDLMDLPAGGKALLRQKEYFFRAVREADSKRPGTWREAVRAYQASCTFADHQIGRLLDALARSDRADSTIVALWSDHGYHLGEKNHWEKFVLWEKATRVPLVIAAPGITEPGTVVETPVSLLDLYPTLLELAGLPTANGLEGDSLVPLFSDTERERTVSMTYQRGNHAVRSKRWRYIRYADGTEELYDHASDRDELRNLASLGTHQDVMRELREGLPRNSAPAAADRK